MDTVISIQGYNLNTTLVDTLYFSSGKGFATLPTDTPANTQIHSGLEQPYILRRDLFSKATTYGAVSAGQGQVILQNEDGSLDYLLSTYAFDGYSIAVWIGTEPNAFPSTWTQIGAGKVETMILKDYQVIFNIYDRMNDLDKPLLPNLYAGNNSLPNGVEGTPTDLMNQRKPRVYGSVLNVSPKFVNTSDLIYQVSDQSCTVSAVRDRGAALTAGAAYSSLSDMYTNAPAAGNYRVLSTSTGTYIRLGSSPNGTVTCDAATTETRAASLMQQVALDMGFVNGTDINTTDVSNLNTLNSAPVGCWVDADKTAKQVMTDLANSIGAYFMFSQNVLRMNRLDAPSGSPVYTVLKDRCLSITMLPVADESNGIPTWQACINFAQNYTTQTDLAGTVSAPARATWALPYLRYVVQDTSVKAVHLLSVPMTDVNSFLTTQSDANTEITRRFALYKVQRRMFEIVVRLEQATIGLLDLGLCITLQYPRYGLDSGVLFRIIGIENNARTGEVKMRLWG